MLGPVRFTHMETVGREAVAAWRSWEAKQRDEERRAKAEAFERERLVKELRERDESVVVLRGLLEVKNGGSKAGAGAKKVVMDYEGLELGRLRMLEKARDSTIAFLLKQIDAAEKGSASSSQVKSEAQAKRNAMKTDVGISSKGDGLSERSSQAAGDSPHQRSDGSPPLGGISSLPRSDRDGEALPQSSMNLQIQGVSEADLDELVSFGDDVDEE